MGIIMKMVLRVGWLRTSFASRVSVSRKRRLKADHRMSLWRMVPPVLAGPVRTTPMRRSRRVVPARPLVRAVSLKLFDFFLDRHLEGGVDVVFVPYNISLHGLSV